MSDKYPYVQSVSKLVEFLKTLPEIGKPDKLNNEKLKALGYSSSNDRPFVTVLKFIRLIDGSNSPTALWDEMRANYSGALAKGVRAGYAELFEQYPNANERDEEALRAYFSANTSVASAAIARMVSTFKALCAEADFSSSESGASLNASVSTHENQTPTVAPPVSNNVAKSSVGGVNINIELTVPSDPTGEVYDKFFQSMRKHLLDAK